MVLPTRMADAQGPFAREGLALRTTPFLVGIVASFGLVLFQAEREFPFGVVLAAALASMVAAAVIAMPWAELPRAAQVVPPVAYLGVVALLVESYGAQSPFSALALLPVVWLALHGTRGELNVALASVAALLLLPPMLVGGPQSAGELRAGILWLVLAVGLGYAIITLVRAQRQRMAALEAAAYTDVITGLPNRRAWEEAAPRYLASERKSEHPVSVAILDLDDFKLYNDEHGHQAGDGLLRRCGERWRNQLRTTDLVARYGGDEFGIIMAGCGLDDAQRLAERLITELPEALTASVGVATWDGSETIDQLVRRADVALYGAKDVGRNRVARAA